MNWRPMRNVYYQQLIKMLKNDEWGHVALASRLKDSDGVFFGNIADGRIWLLENDGIIYGCLYISRQGSVFPVFDPEKLGMPEKQALRKILMSQRHRIYLVQGMMPRVSLVDELLGMHPSRERNYRLLTCSSPANGTKEIGLPVKIRPASTADVRLLWPLERGYLIEEVIEEGSQLNEDLAKRRLHHALKTHLIYCTLLHELPVAKAGTNGRGWKYDQIGGVFVSPTYRNLGLGRLVMMELLKTIEKMHRQACLFVDISNKPALHLYTSIGFVDRGGYRISYWED